MTVDVTKADAGATSGTAADGSAGAGRLARAVTPRPLPLLPALALAVAAGVGMLLAFPPYDLWWLAPVAVALLAVAVHRRRLRSGAGVGALAGIVFFAPLLSWTNLELGSVPWLLLSGLQAGYLALLGAAAALVSPLADRWRWSWPLLTAVAWVGQEALRSRTPFGGFPWGRLAFSQGDSPLLPLAALGGAPLVSFAVALAGGLLATGGWYAATAVRAYRAGALGAVAGRRRAVLAGAAGLGAAGLVLAGGYAVPQPFAGGPAAGDEQVTVALVQGNVPRLGFDFNAQRRAVLENHVQATLTLAAEVAAGTAPQPDLVIWPENSSDIDPLVDAQAYARIDAAAAAIGVPILVGAGVREDGRLYNVGLVWDPRTGPGEQYAKRQPVPFAEYLPLRPLVLPAARLIVPDPDRIWLLRDGVGYEGGDAPGVLAMGPATIGNVICFEVAYDGIVRDTVTGGAQLLTVQTNNATFNEAEARQQMAMVRVRAVEHGREALMVSTVGISGFVDVDGQVYDATGFFTQDVRVRTLSLASSRTPATVVGFWPELALSLAAVAALVVAAALRRRVRKEGSP